MNGSQRIRAALAGDRPDRVPVMLHNFLMAAREAGHSQRRFRENPAAIAGSFIQAVETYGYDGVVVDVDTVTVAEALGVPHTEVDLILVNGDPVDFSYRLRDGDGVSVYPVFESLDISDLIRPHTVPLREVKFILDEQLGTLARMLRLLGFDTIFQSGLSQKEFIDRATAEKRIILTKNTALLKHNTVSRGHFIHAFGTLKQAAEVLKRFDLARQVRPFSRCSLCNGQVEAVDKSSVEPLLEPKTRDHYHRFFRCRSCGQVYWKGSHHRKIEQKIKTLLQRS